MENKNTHIEAEKLDGKFFVIGVLTLVNLISAVAIGIMLFSQKRWIETLSFLIVVVSQVCFLNQIDSLKKLSKLVTLNSEVDTKKLEKELKEQKKLLEKFDDDGK